ncbi:MAG: Magnesium transporter MgtE [Chlamydiia bacterium]|nr:Magnesium transporter MgtE [Chlamydiia bacterium]MCH9615682.1 Magnesium transporter MgtE [Chlamydiia bacterium]MCH9628915.1 Magnesium transporter MgtE [Chlamydiia bacterium]
MSEKDLSKQVKDFVTPVKTVTRYDHTIKQALREIRSRSVHDKIVYFYVVNEDNQLLGVVSTRRLLLDDPTKLIGDVMERSVICLQGNQTLQEAMEFLESHHLLALPVVDENRVLLGVVDVDLYLEESMDVAKQQHRNDVFQMIGISLDEGKKFSYLRNYMNRMPWIFCNMFGGIACAVISRIYEGVLAQFLLLAMFLPLVLSLSESISMQSLTQSMHILRGGQKRSLSSLAISLFREWRVVVLLGCTSGVIIGAISILWGDGLSPAIVIAVSSICGIFISAVIGSLVPVVVHKRGWDPKVAAGPVVLMFADVMTTLFYLTLATLTLL